MTINEPLIKLPSDMDEKCVDLCNTLNRLPFVETRESCSGHGEHPYWVFFRCTDIGVLSRLGRAVAKNYSDNNWEIVVDSCDGDPYGCFWLRTKEVLPDNVLDESLKNLIENILYWFDDVYDEYFNPDGSEKPCIKDTIVQIDGVRHKLVDDNVGNPCDQCSLEALCDDKNLTVGICVDLFNGSGSSHFIKLEGTE